MIPANKVLTLFFSLLLATCWENAGGGGLVGGLLEELVGKVDCWVFGDLVGGLQRDFGRAGWPSSFIAPGAAITAIAPLVPLWSLP